MFRILFIILVFSASGCTADREAAAQDTYLEALRTLQEDPARGLKALRDISQHYPDTGVAADARQRLRLALNAYSGTINRGLASYRHDNGRYPDDSHGLADLITNAHHLPTWRGPYVSLDLAALLDFFDYHSDGTRFRLNVR